jgi:hypothetical protein
MVPLVSYNMQENFVYISGVRGHWYVASAAWRIVHGARGYKEQGARHKVKEEEFRSQENKA